MIFRRLQALTLVWFCIRFCEQRVANQLVDIADTLFKFRCRKLAQVGTQIWFQTISIGCDVEPTIEQVE